MTTDPRTTGDPRHHPEDIEGLQTRTVAELIAELLDQLDAKTAEVAGLSREVDRLRRCAVCNRIDDPFLMMVGLCYRHAAELRTAVTAP